MTQAINNRAFFNTSYDLAKLFTRANHWNIEKQGKYMNDGLKPIEAFENDICKNLIEWTCEGKMICYRTKEFSYVYEIINRDGCNIISITRFGNMSWERIDTWCNLHTTSVGKSWLNHTDQKCKRVPMFNH